MSGQGQGPILIAGQTASGKSGLALRLAQRLDAVIINADSMQVYGELRLLTARPTQAEMGGVPHELYGHIAAHQPYSVGEWLKEAAALIEELRQQDRACIVIGGTGLYFKALLEGLSPVPDIPDDIRSKWRLYAQENPGELHRILTEKDPALAQKLPPGDLQRLARALEVIDATGKSLLYWRAQPNRPALQQTPRAQLVIAPERAELYRRCDARFDRMMREGALDEVEKLLALRLPFTLPLMRALGVRPLASYLRGEMEREEAIERAKTETRQYAKRQMTWQKGNMIAWKWLDAQDMECLEPNILPLV